MSLYENIDIPYMEQLLKNLREDLDSCLQIAKRWDRRGVLCVLMLFLLAALNIVVIITTRSLVLSLVALSFVICAGACGVICACKEASWRSQASTLYRLIILTASDLNIAKKFAGEGSQGA